MNKMDDPIIALLTDFGESDYFIPSMKGVIASINPHAQVIDLTHTVPSFDVHAGRFVLFASYRFFPKGTIFVAVVDPGVGSDRKILLVETKKYFFIAPDNGLLSLVLDEEDDFTAREISNPRFFIPQSGVTFEGRDKMSPVSAWLSLGISPEEFGPRVMNVQRNGPSPPQITDHEIVGTILYADKFGNLITNIPSSFIDSLVKKNERVDLRLTAGERSISFGEFYSAVPKSEPLFLHGSLGLIEIAIREGSASEKLKLKSGSAIKITY